MKTPNRSKGRVRAAWQSSGRLMLLAVFLMSCLLSVGIVVLPAATPVFGWGLLIVILAQVPLPAWIFMEDGRRISLAFLLSVISIFFTVFVGLMALLTVARF